MSQFHAYGTHVIEREMQKHIGNSKSRVSVERFAILVIQKVVHRKEPDSFVEYKEGQK